MREYLFVRRLERSERRLRVGWPWSRSLETVRATVIERVVLATRQRALFACAALAVVAALTMLPTLGAQTASRLEGTGCRDCLRIVPHLVLGDSSDRGAISVGRGLVRRDDGSFVHAGVGGLTLFTATGMPAGAIGRVGSGPLEFRRLNFIARGLADTLIVFDLGNGRLSKISPRLEQVAQFTLTNQVTNAVVLPTGSIVANIHFRDLDRLGVPLHVIDGRSGEVTHSFGLARTEAFDRKSAWAGFREIAVSPRGNIWSTRRNSYVLEEWTAAGEKIRQLERSAAWFHPYELREPLRPNSPPQPHIERIHVDSSGLLWVFAAVPALDWRENIVARKPTPGILPGFEPTSLSGIYDTIIEVIDPVTRRVLVTQRFDGFMWGMLSDSMMFSDAQDQAGFPTLQVWRVEVSGLSLFRR